MVNFKQYLGKLGFLFLFLLVQFLIVELVLTLINGLQGYRSVYLLVVLIWLSAIISVLFIFLKRQKIKLEMALGYLLFIAPIIYYLSYIPISLSGLNRFSVIPRNYFGISNAQVSMVIDDYEVTDQMKYKGLYVLYEEGKNASNFTHSVDTDFGIRPFIFWQTAVANGYNPSKIPFVNCCNSSNLDGPLIITIAPLTILEISLGLLPQIVILILIGFILRVFGFNLFFNFTDLRKFLSD